MGRVVILTGAAGGIGLAVTETLLNEGHSVVAVDKDTEALERLCHGLRKLGAADRVHVVTADLSTESDCEKSVENAVAHFGRVEAVINNAGIGVSSLREDAEKNHPSIEELNGKVWDRFFAVNVRAPMLVTRNALPHMKSAGWGRVINNTTSYLTMLRVLPYGATKAALESMSAVWANELKGAGITVNVLIPGGPTDTPFIADDSGIPRGRMLKPSVMGPPAAWLVSDGSQAFTGHRIIAARWDTALPPAQAAQKAARAIGWPELTHDVVWPED
jgi:NAD(P)-dependent dehydrogenase (short-subunit alcohol dehydrogenase family)